MNKIERIVAEFLSEKFKEWKDYLTSDEQTVFILFYFKCYPLAKISEETHYSTRTIQRLLRSARKKIAKLLP